MDNLLKKNDFIEAVIWIFISLFVIIYGAGLHHGENPALSPALFPIIIGVFMLVLSCVLIKKALKAPSREKKDISWVKILWVSAMTFLYIFAMPIVGFIGATMIYLALMVYILGEKDLLKLGIVAVGATGAIYYIFDVLLNVRLP